MSFTFSFAPHYRRAAIADAKTREKHSSLSGSNAGQDKECMATSRNRSQPLRKCTMRVFCGSVHPDLCPRDDAAFCAMHAISRIDSPTDNAIRGARATIDVVTTAQRALLESR